MKHVHIALFSVLLIISIAFAFPKPTGYVNDYANILTEKQNTESILSAYEKNTTIEIAVVTLEGVPEGYTLTTYGVDLFKDWGIGKKGEDNGILVLIVKNGTIGNRLRIELGYGIQGYITGAEAGRILDKALPDYEQGNYQSALNIILNGLSNDLTDYKPGEQNFSKNKIVDILSSVFISNPVLWVVIAMIILSSIFTRNRCPYCMKGKLECKGDSCVCKRCGKKFKKKKRYAPFLIAGGGFGGSSGGGFGGFGGGGSGGGGAGR